MGWARLTATVLDITRRDRTTVLRLAEQEPRTSTQLCAVLGARSGRDWREHHAGPAGRSSCVTVRLPGGTWVAYPLLGHDDDAPDLAAMIDRSPAIGIDGRVDDVEPLLPHLTRAGALSHFRKLVIPPGPGFDWPPPDPRSRMATAIDLPGIVQLFEDYEISFARTRRVRRLLVAEAIARCGAVVVGEPDRIDGAFLLEGATPSFQIWGHLRVRPECRGQGLSWAVVSRVVALFQAAGLGFMATLSDDNPMTMPGHLGWIEQQASANLSLPNRVPGERGLRRTVRSVTRKWEHATASRPR